MEYIYKEIYIYIKSIYLKNYISRHHRKRDTLMTKKNETVININFFENNQINLHKQLPKWTKPELKIPNFD